MPCRKADRILYYNYTTSIIIERNVTREVTTREYKCPPGVEDIRSWYVKSTALLYSNFLIKFLNVLSVNELACSYPTESGMSLDPCRKLG